jgi:PAS domain S-box-containing protein
MTHPPRLRRSKAKAVEFFAILATVAIGLVASVSAWHLNQGLPREQQVRDALENIRLDTTQLRALEWRLVAGKVESRDTLASQLILDDMATQSQVVTGLHKTDRTATAVDAVKAAFRQLAPTLGTQSLKQANQAYRTHYLPARIELEHVVLASHRATERKLDSTEREIKIGTILSVLSAALLVVALALRANRGRAREIHMVRKADSELSESNELLLDSERRVRSAERLYRQLVERLPGVTYISSPASVGPTFISPQALELLGLPAEEFISHPEMAMQVIHPDDREGVEANMEVLRRDGGEYSGEFRVVHPDGRVVWIGDHAVVVPGEDEKPLHVQGYLRDITPFKEAEARQSAALEMEQSANEKLRELGAMKDDFVALVSHELRTPLTSIRGYLELVLDGKSSGLTKEDGEFLGIVDRNAARLERLVDDLLFMARLGSGKLELSLEDTDLAALARESVGAATPRATAQAVKLECEVDEVPPVSGDPGRLGQLLDNLISNAVKFTPDGGSVDVRVFPRNGDIQGTGLGLSISKAIVEAHHGRIELESEENIGTTIRVLLPVAGSMEHV